MVCRTPKVSQEANKAVAASYTGFCQYTVLLMLDVSAVWGTQYPLFYQVNMLYVNYKYTLITF